MRTAPRVGVLLVALALLASPVPALAATAPLSENAPHEAAADLTGPAPPVAATVGLADLATDRALRHGLSAQEHLPTATGSVEDRLALRVLELRYPIPPDTGDGKRIVYSNSRQRLWLVAEDGSLLDTYLISGRRGSPRAGRYRVYSKSELAWAGHDGITMRFMVRFARGPNGVPIGFHEIPEYGNGRPMQTEDQLGTFRSGGCVRQSTSKAVFLFGWADLGTRVAVIR